MKLLLITFSWQTDCEALLTCNKEAIHFSFSNGPMKTFVVVFFCLVFLFLQYIALRSEQHCIRFTLTHLADRLLLHNRMQCGAKCFWNGEKRWGFSKALLKDKFQRRLQIQPEFINCHFFGGVWAMWRSSRSLYVVYGTERKVSGITFQMCRFFSPQVLINFAFVMTTCVCSAARVTLVDVCSHACRQPPAAHRRPDEGPTLDWPLWSRHVSPSELFPSLRLPFFLRPPPPLALLVRRL